MVTSLRVAYSESPCLGKQAHFPVTDGVPFTICPRHPFRQSGVAATSKCHYKLTSHMQKTRQDGLHLGSFILDPFGTLKIQSPQFLELLLCNFRHVTLLIYLVSAPTYLST